MAIDGRVSGATLKLAIESAGTKRSMDVGLSGPIHLASDLDLVLEREGLEVGKKFTMPFFDPSSLSMQSMSVEVEAREQLKLGGDVIPVYRVRQDFADVSVRSWVSPDLGTVKAEGLMGFVFLMETREQAVSRPEGGYGTADIIAMSSIPAGGDITSPRDTSYMKASLKGASMDGLDVDGGRQVFDGGVITIRREDTSALEHVKIPVTDVALSEYLSPEAFVQSDDAEIIRRSKEAVGGETDALSAARRLSDWVYTNMDKKPSAGIPSAVEVLKGLQGDCNEHTVLYTAMARSLGIPTRMASGIVMLDGRFYYHAWPEVYVGGWVSIDPTFGQFPADATHIRFVEGGPARQIAIIKLIGNLKVDVLEHG